MKKIVVGALSGITILMLVGIFMQRHALACELLPLMEYQRASGEIFVEDELSAAQVDTLAGLVNAASARMTHVYGKPNSEPRLLILSNAKAGAKWGANETGTMHRMPWRSCIIIGPKGRNVDVIAHEWLHAEIQHRVGFLRTLSEIPTWFDEGAALTLDYREPFLLENIDLADVDVQAVKGLTNARDFFAGTSQQNYLSARLAVEPLIKRQHFFDDLERVSSGESFDIVFLQAEKSIDSAAIVAAD